MHVTIQTSLLQNQGLNEEATNAQIDTLILDNRKKLNQIIGMLDFLCSYATVLTHCI